MTSTKKFIEKFKKIKTVPHSVSRLIQLVNDQESTLQDFESVIRLDPALVARLLTLVNSSFFTLNRKVDSIPRAVALLGMKNLHTIAVTDAIQDMLRTRSNSTKFSPQRLWLHSAAAAICCKMIAERIFAINGDDVYLCAILHDIGLIVEMQVEQEAFLKLVEQAEPECPPFVQLEQQLFGTDHCEIGYTLAKDWHIPLPIAEAIRDHHLEEDAAITPQSPTGILQMSEYIIQQLDFSTAEEGLPCTLSPSLAEHIQSNMDEYKVIAEDLPEELEKMKNMYGG